MTRVAAIGDLHGTVADRHRFAALFEEIGEVADCLLLAGDLLELGLEAELPSLLADLARCALPKIAVLGNHDYYSGRVPQITAHLEAAGIAVLEHEIATVEGIDIIGCKGTVGGFERMLSPIAEPEVVAFAQLSRTDADHLDRTLQRAGSARRIVLMHHAPVVDTIKGEAMEEYVFMGSSRYAEVIDRHRPQLVIHGHAHYGTHSGRTPAGVPVFNVAMPVAKPGGRPYSVFEV